MLASVAAISCGEDPKSLVFAVQPNVLSTDMTVTLTVFFTLPEDANPPTEVKVRVAGSKDEIALTEGNARVLGNATSGGVFMGRPLEGTSYQASVAYRW